MARRIYEEVSQDVQDEFDSVIVRKMMDQLMNIKILGDEKQKKEVIKVKRIDDLNYHIHGEDVVMIVNQTIFDQLTPPQKVLAIEIALANVTYDYDKDMVVPHPADVKAHSGILKDVSFETFEVLQESIKSLYDKQAQEEKDSKGK